MYPAIRDFPFLFLCLNGNAMKTYLLRLTADERRQIDSVGFRHWCGFDLRSILCRCPQEHTEIGWRYKGQLDFDVEEGDALEIVSLAKRNDYFAPCLDVELAAKIIGWVNAVETCNSGDYN